MAQDYAEPSFDFEQPGASPRQEVSPWRRLTSRFFIVVFTGLVLAGALAWLKPSLLPASWSSTGARLSAWLPFISHSAEDDSASSHSYAPSTSTRSSVQTARQPAPVRSAKPTLASASSHVGHSLGTGDDDSAKLSPLSLAAKQSKRLQTYQPTFDFYTVLPEGEEASYPAAAGQQALTSLTEHSPLLTRAQAANDTIAEQPSARTPPTEIQPSSAGSVSPTVTNEASIEAAVNEELQQQDQTHEAMLSPSSPAKTTLPTPSLHQPSITAVAPSEYALQVGAFRLHRDADELRARLLLEGFSAKIQVIQDKQHDTWHRVMIGPFADRAHARAQCEQVREFGHECLLRG